MKLFKLVLVKQVCRKCGGSGVIVTPDPRCGGAPTNCGCGGYELVEKYVEATRDDMAECLQKMG